MISIRLHEPQIPVPKSESSVEREGLLLYMASVDCYLISGAKVSLDVDLGLLTEHTTELQQSFLRSLLGLNSSSMLAILYTETGQIPMKGRRLLRALSRLRYLTLCQMRTSSFFP